MNINKLVGVTIDTNGVYIPTIKDGQQDSAFKKISSHYDLTRIRRVVTRKDVFFTAFTYNYSETSLGETLEQYLTT